MVNLILISRYKGYISRKYDNDYYSRKKFLEHVRQKARNIQIELKEQADQNEIEYKKFNENAARAEFSMIAKNLHHLISTQVQSGVYNSPYTKNKPRAFNVDVETHLKSSFKSRYRWKPPTKNRISFYKELGKEEFFLKTKLNKINKSILCDPLSTTVVKIKTKISKDRSKSTLKY